MLREADRLGRAGQRGRRLGLVDGHRGDPGVGGCVVDPRPLRHRHALRGAGPLLRVLHGYVRTPFEVRREGGREFGVVREARLCGALFEKSDPPGPLPIGQVLAEVLGDHPGVAAVALRVHRRATKYFRQPAGDPLGVVGGHRREQRTDERVLRHVLLIEDPGRKQEGRPATGPLEQRWFVVRVSYRIVEVDVPVHPRTERLVLRLPAPAQAVVLERGALIARHRGAIGIDQRDAAGGAVGPIL